MRYRWKMILLALFLALTPTLLMPLFGHRMLERLEHQLLALTSQRLMDRARDDLLLAARSLSDELAMGSRILEMVLMYQAELVADTLAHPAGPPESVASAASALHTLEPEFSSYVLSSRHAVYREDVCIPLPVNYGDQSLWLAPGADLDAVRSQLHAVRGLIPVYQRLYQRVPESVLWMFTCLDSGLCSLYPAVRAPLADRDLRSEPWYVQAMSPAGAAAPTGASGADPAFRWSTQQLDPVTGQVVAVLSLPILGAKGAPIGATGVSLPMEAAVRETMAGQANLPPGTMWYFVYPEELEDGRTGLYIIDRWWQGDELKQPLTGENMFLTSADSLELDTLTQTLATRARQSNESRDSWLRGRGERIDPLGGGASGFTAMDHAGKPSLWAWASFPSGAAFILVAPRDDFLEPVRRSQAIITDLVDQGASALLPTGLSVLVAVVLLAMLFARQVTRPLESLAEGMLRVADGDFTARVRVRSSDELGRMGRIFNDVVPKVERLTRTQSALAVAREVQQNLLPRHEPRLPGLDIFGASLYCDETGGDYYDFLDVRWQDDEPCPATGHVDIVVADVSGHGVGAALLMTTVRALLRLRTAGYRPAETAPRDPARGELAEVVRDVNRLLTPDVFASGSFVTMFFCRVETCADAGSRRAIRWVRAGHDPALLYDPYCPEDGDALPEGDDPAACGLFRELSGKGAALGMTQDMDYREYATDLLPGQVLVIGTDGIWETRNRANQMYGKNRLKAVVAAHARRSAKEIAKAVAEDLAEYRDGMDQEDDVTLVVVRVLGASEDEAGAEPAAARDMSSDVTTV